MIKSKIPALVLSALAIALGAGALESTEQSSLSFDGMDGRQILESIRSHHRPTAPLSDPEEIRRIVLACAASPDGIRNYFDNGATVASHVLRLVPVAWWSDRSSDYALAVTDLHNVLPADAAVETIRRDYPPGIVVDVDYDSGNWKCGIGSVDEQLTNLYEPADNLKGDFARIYLYMAAAYPQTLWYGRATIIYLDGYYPLLTKYGRQLLMDWHRSDPVDRHELYRDSVIAAAQGNHNPFVVSPDLAEYIWGRYSDTIYNDPDAPDDPDMPQPPQPGEEPIMLKSRYSVSSDGRIDFRSPYVAAGSKWTFDGRVCEDASLSLDGVAPGRYVITYSNPHASGRIIVTVEP